MIINTAYDIGDRISFKSKTNECDIIPCPYCNGSGNVIIGKEEVQCEVCCGSRTYVTYSYSTKIDEGVVTEVSISKHSQNFSEEIESIVYTVRTDKGGMDVINEKDILCLKDLNVIED